MKTWADIFFYDRTETEFDMSIARRQVAEIKKRNKEKGLYTRKLNPIDYIEDRNAQYGITKERCSKCSYYPRRNEIFLSCLFCKEPKEKEVVN